MTIDEFLNLHWHHLGSGLEDLEVDGHILVVRHEWVGKVMQGTFYSRGYIDGELVATESGEEYGSPMERVCRRLHSELFLL